MRQRARQARELRPVDSRGRGRYVDGRWAEGPPDPNTSGCAWGAGSRDAQTRQGTQARRPGRGPRPPVRYNTLSSSRRFRLQASLKTWLPLLGTCLMVWAVGGGCGDQVACPAGMAGAPCRYTTGARGVASPLPPLDVNGPYALDASADTAIDGPDAGDAGPDGETSDDDSDAHGEAGDHDQASPSIGRTSRETPDDLPQAGLASARPALRAARHALSSAGG